MLRLKAHASGIRDLRGGGTCEHSTGRGCAHVCLRGLNNRNTETRRHQRRRDPSNRRLQPSQSWRSASSDAAAARSRLGSPYDLATSIEPSREPSSSRARSLADSWKPKSPARRPTLNTPVSQRSLASKNPRSSFCIAVGKVANSAASIPHRHIRSSKITDS